MLLDLPEQWQELSLYLLPKDVLSFVSIHRNIYKCLSASPSFWRQLLVRDVDYEETLSEGENTSVAADIRQAFLLQSFMSSLSSVKWLPVSRNLQQRQFPVKAREGHNSCVLNGPAGFKSLVITGGFSDDQGVTVMTLKKGLEAHNSNWGWTRLSPRYSDEPTFVYGASLTPLPPALSEEMEKDRFMRVRPGIIEKNVAKAVRFGGFEGGGYSGETNEVWVLTIVDYDYEDSSLDQFAVWEKMETQGPSPRARAYHSATLIHDRYLVIIGGMTQLGSCIEESVLDTKTWTWIDMELKCKGEPTGRHGHSVVWDKRRDRLVMFGGGSGTDLLRTGTDCNEVWELKMNGIVAIEEYRSPVRSQSSSVSDNEMMWEWSKIHKNTLPRRNHSMRMRSGDDSDSDDSAEGTNDSEIDLSPSESLCLGRCHNAMKISPDTILLMFGGGRPSTNGMLGYDLAKDTFLRPNVAGPLPVPRFTGVASFLETEGYILVHGGFNDATGGAVLDMNVLDLAPSLGRQFAGFPLDEDRQSQEAVSDEAARNGRYGADPRPGPRQMSALQRLLLAQMYEAQMNGL
eukprot:CAMPEP_0201699036 /NCGR_PEP_ID=MMETSP0578-20130828/21987_1 /ASSEMBLY_ACC=CAM_ASM_000663 /TAXON_ID=267565 /ORGANISM="Skeletonema grethea, Strain CCMP 1804" /LENGTH=570 /DNA_ID=CAMNT_0048185701 /DNA_START=89 /DNA_END=1801 /DNA_ORIENTATION=+